MKIFKKIGSIILIYVIYFLIFFGGFFGAMRLIKFDLDFMHFAMYTLLIVPIISFFIIPKRLIKKLNINKYFLWIFHIIFIYLVSMILTLFILSSALKDFSIIF